MAPMSISIGNANYGQGSSVRAKDDPGSDLLGARFVDIRPISSEMAALSQDLMASSFSRASAMTCGNRSSTPHFSSAVREATRS
jgi:hypothetical protein